MSDSASVRVRIVRCGRTVVKLELLELRKYRSKFLIFLFFFQAEDGIRDDLVTGVQTCALPIFADNSRMPFRDACFDVVVYDPPHIPNQGKDKSKDFNTRFGLVLNSSKENNYTFSQDRKSVV